jgi:nucleoid DNA-binding protein
MTREKEVHKSEQVDIDGVGDIEQKEERGRQGRKRL